MVSTPQLDSKTPTPETPPSLETNPDPSPKTPALNKTTNQFEIDASTTSDFAYFKIENGSLIKSAAEQSWQFAVKRTQFQTNSGTSGSQNFGVFNTETTDYTGISRCAASTLTYDEMLPASGAPGSLPHSGNALLNSWYNYDSTTHVVSPKKHIYLISNGTSCFKLQILSYASGIYKVLADPLEIPAVVTPEPEPTPEPQDPSQTIDASSSTASVYLKFDQGRLVSSTADAVWHFSIKRTQFQTNSGTSGSLQFGVADTTMTDYAQVSSCSAPLFNYDEMLPASGAPGSQPYSGNAVLNAWYAYNPTTHVVSSKNMVYLISDGTSCYKMQILSYASGIYKVLTDTVAIPPPPPAPVVYEQTGDASSTLNTVYLQLDQGQLVTTTSDQA